MTTTTANHPRPTATASTATPAESLNPAGQRPGEKPTVVLELRVRNHPGTMSHITGLFARRTFNLEAIVCVPVGDGDVSRMLLLVGRDGRLPQVEQQLQKLHDVLEFRERSDLSAEYFNQLAND